MRASEAREIKVATVAMTKQVNDKRALVVGLGLSGLSSARYLARHGYVVTVADSRAQPPGLGALHAELPDVRAHTGSFDAALFRDPGLLVVSPGVPIQQAQIAEALGREDL